jgi:isoleucyl-tRNA synthetase
VPGGYPFPALELSVLDTWRRRQTFRRTLEKTAAGVPFVFFEGPPTANNVPHVGHVVTRVVKDLFPRFQTMRGRNVRRKAGWDTHGLPVEIEVEKRLGFTGKQQIEAYGIAAFNKACLESVHTYEEKWRAMSERVGYWLDMDDAYFTYTNDYIESEWWAVKELWTKNLLVESYKIQPYCARCGTTLSSHEVAQNYKLAQDPSIWTLFRLRPGASAQDLDGRAVDLSGAGLVGWTTTPWTTLANAAVAVHPRMNYKLIAHPARAGESLIIGEGLDTPVPAEIDDPESGKRKRLDLRAAPALARFAGAALEHLTYDRLFEFFEPGLPGRVVLGEYVTASEGTGLVHTAPPFGEDDYLTGVRYGLPLWLSVDSEGKLVADAGPFAGLWFKDADPKIVADLKSRGLMLHADRYEHNYPFCWRCDRPLLYYATKSWFVKTTAERDKLVRYNRDRIAWHPAHVGEGRFGNWLENLVDWALSRKRYWGTPLPVWKCDLCPSIEVVGSYDELFALSGRERPADLYDSSQFDPHRPYIDDFTWACYACRKDGRNGTFRRVDDVIDAWFDSGAMPFAQHHYPFENADLIDGRKQFPADFIAEAVDQTRGWFYTLHVLATLLFDDVAYRNCVVMGHVNDDSGRKMSKRLGNVVEPMAVIEETGADAMRWYFCVNDPEQPSRFSARLVREAAQTFMIPLWNALSFFTIYANIDGWHPGRAPQVPLAERPDLDRWILLRLDELVAATNAGLESYQIAPTARRIEAFLDELTNWYIRRSRGRFWEPVADASGSGREKEAAYQTLYTVLTTLARLLAPYVPFFAETLHEHLVRSQGGGDESVHLEPYPTAQAWLDSLDPVGRRDAAGLIEAMALAQRLVGLGRAARNTHNLKTRQPLAAVTLVFSAEARGRDLRAEVERVRALLLEELNVKDIRWAARRADFVRHEVKPIFPILGKRLGKKMPALKAALEAADGDALAEALERDGGLTVEVDGEPIVLAPEEVEVRLIEKPGLATAGDRELLVVLDTALTPELVAEGRAREVVNRLQTARKEADLDYADRIRVRFTASPELAQAIAAHRDWIAGETLAVEMQGSDTGGDLKQAPVDELDFAFAIERVS